MIKKKYPLIPTSNRATYFKSHLRL